MSEANPKTAPVARLVSSSTAFNTLNTPPAIPIHFHKSPDFPSGGRGIAGLDFQVVVNGAVISQGTTGADGKVDVRVPPGGSATLQILFNGAVVSEYEVTVDSNPLSDLDAGDAVIDPEKSTEAANDVSLRGTQERLRMLGYQIGHDGDEGTGVNGKMSAQWERSILDFQNDQNLFADAKIGPQTKAALRKRAGA